MVKNDAGADLYKWKSKKSETELPDKDDSEIDLDFIIRINKIDPDTLDNIETTGDESETPYVPDIKDFYFDGESDDDDEDIIYTHMFEELHFDMFRKMGIQDKYK